MTFIQDMLTGPLNRVSAVYRFSSMHVHKQESVAEHSFMVALYAYQINARVGSPATLDELLLRAIAHDLEESLTGDFVRSFKYSDPELAAAISSAAYSFMTQMTNDSDLVEAWDKAKDDTIEGQIIRVADYASVVSYVIREMQMGNRHMIAVAYECSVYGASVCSQVNADLRVLTMDMMELLQQVRQSCEDNATNQNGGHRGNAGHDLAGEQNG